MKTSVIVTTHESSSFLRRVLHGFLDQTELPDEVIIADDGSGAETRRVVDAFKNQAPFTVIHSWQPFDGTMRVCHSRNQATRYSTGEYLIYIDGDCIPGVNFVLDHKKNAQPGYYIQGKRIFLTSKAPATFTGREPFFQQLILSFQGGLEKRHLLLRIPGLTRRQYNLHGTRSCNFAVFRKDVIQINGWDKQYHGYGREDSDFALRLTRQGIRRNNALFSAILYHIEHPVADHSEDVKRNDRLLYLAKSGPIKAKYGLFTQEELIQLAAGVAESELFEQYSNTLRAA